MQNLKKISIVKNLHLCRELQRIFLFFKYKNLFKIYALDFGKHLVSAVGNIQKSFSEIGNLSLTSEGYRLNVSPS